MAENTWVIRNEFSSYHHSCFAMHIIMFTLFWIDTCVMMRYDKIGLFMGEDPSLFHL